MKTAHLHDVRPTFTTIKFSFISRVEDAGRVVGVDAADGVGELQEDLIGLRIGQIDGVASGHGGRSGYGGVAGGYSAYHEQGSAFWARCIQCEHAFDAGLAAREEG